MDLGELVLGDPTFSSRFKLGEKLGEGGMGSVHRAIQTALGRPVAIKFIYPELVADGANRERFIQEATLAARLVHSNVVAFSLLSGLATPIASMPHPMQTAMLINPLRYALDITKRVYLEDAGFTLLLRDFIPLTVSGVIALTGAAWLFRRRLG